MRFYTQQHQFYCGIDLQARTMYVCIMDNEGKVLTHKNMTATAENLIDVIEPYRSDVVLAVECIFTWYWIACLLRGGMLPIAYVYPQQMRSTRDLLRRRMYMARQRAELQTHIQNTVSFRQAFMAEKNIPVDGGSLREDPDKTDLYAGKDVTSVVSICSR